jgi:hypothetical protein
MVGAHITCLTNMLILGCLGILVASRTEREIFDRLGVVRAF